MTEAGQNSKRLIRNVGLALIVSTAIMLITSGGPLWGQTNALISIENAECGSGEYAEVSIKLEDVPIEMGGFDFLVACDPSALTPTEAALGQVLQDCEWEYFTYRFDPGQIRLVALADVDNGNIHPSCYGSPSADPYELAAITFYISGNPTLIGQVVPIYFFWDDCGDNVVSSVDGYELFVSDHVYDFEGTEITDSSYGFPTYFGVQTECLGGGGPEDPELVRSIDFRGGSLRIYGTWLCGDANGDDIINILDITFLISYLYLGGPPPFPLVAVDINSDGVINVLDVTYLISYLYMGGSPPNCSR